MALATPSAAEALARVQARFLAADEKENAVPAAAALAVFSSPSLRASAPVGASKSTENESRNKR